MKYNGKIVPIDENSNEVSQYELETKDVMIVTDKGDVIAKKPTKVVISDNLSKKILYIVNGKEISETDFRTIQPDDIESVTVLKDKNATEKYGAKGKDGVIEIQLKEKKS